MTRLIENRLRTRGLVVLIATMILIAACSDGGSDSQFPVKVTDERVSAGAQVYATNCAACHGPLSGPVVIPGTPPHSVDGHTWHHADRHLFEWILDGPPLAQIMPPFRGQLSDDEVMAVLAYIKSGWPGEIRDRQDQLSATVEQQIIDDAGG